MGALKHVILIYVPKGGVIVLEHIVEKLVYQKRKAVSSLKGEEKNTENDIMWS